MKYLAITALVSVSLIVAAIAAGSSVSVLDFIRL